MADDPTPTPAPAPSQSADPPKSFTQEDVDRIVQDRVARTKATPPADYEDLKKAAGKLAELEKQSLSDLEKAQAEAAASKAEAATARAEATVARIHAKVVAEATRAGAVDPEAVAALLPKDSVTVGDDGQVAGAEDAVKALLEAKSYLVGKPTTRPAPGSANGGPQGDKPAQWTREDLKGKTSAQIEEARQGGLLDTLMRSG